MTDAQELHNYYSLVYESKQYHDMKMREAEYTEIQKLSGYSENTFQKLEFGTSFLLFSIYLLIINYFCSSLTPSIWIFLLAFVFQQIAYLRYKKETKKAKKLKERKLEASLRYQNAKDNFSKYTSEITKPCLSEQYLSINIIKELLELFDRKCVSTYEEALLLYEINRKERESKEFQEFLLQKKREQQLHEERMRANELRRKEELKEAERREEESQRREEEWRRQEEEWRREDERRRMEEAERRW